MIEWMRTMSIIAGIGRSIHAVQCNMNVSLKLKTSHPQYVVSQYFNLKTWELKLIVN